MVPSLGLAKPKSVELTYFDIAGVADKIRLTLLMGGVPFKAGLSPVSPPHPFWPARHCAHPRGVNMTRLAPECYVINVVNVD